MSGTDETCEWPAGDSRLFKCGKPAKVYLVAPGCSWGRWLCGIHRGSADRRGWSEDQVRSGSSARDE